MFEIHPQLRRDCFILGRFSLCHLLLMNDSNYPWFILVPDRHDVREIYELSEEDQRQLIKESSLLAGQLAAHFKADKMNIAALGNVVPQLHIHHIVRYANDPAWPAPIWGRNPAQAFKDGVAEGFLRTLKPLLGTGFSSGLQPPLSST